MAAGLHNYCIPDPSRRLSTEVSGGGTVISSPEGISCGVDCTATFLPDVRVTLTATPAGGHVFEGWDHSPCGSDATCTVTVERALTIQARFARRHLIRVVIKGNGVLSVLSNSGVIDCKPGFMGDSVCEERVAPGASITLWGELGAGASFEGWSGRAATPQNCASLDRCLVMVDQDTEVVAEARGVNNLAFVTREEYVAGELGGLAAADDQCTTLAHEAGLTGTFVAWLSDSTTSAMDRLAGARGWKRVDGVPFADAAPDMTRAGPGNQLKILAPLAVDQHGALRVAATWRPVLTQTSADGAVPLGDGGTGTCGDWTNPGATQRNLWGGLLTSAGSWSTGSGIFGEDMPCREQFPIYCLQTNFRNALDYARQKGRLAFAAGPWGPVDGLASADALCQSEAARASLAGSFKALLPTSRASAASRFDLGREPWVRPDGVRIAPTTAAFMSGDWRSSLHVTATGEYVYSEVWLGTNTPSFNDASTPERTCLDWTSSSRPNEGWGYFVDRLPRLGFVSSTSGDSGETISCDAEERKRVGFRPHIYCLQD